MADTLDLKLIIKHLANGTLGDNLCIICLLPLTNGYESIFTEICKEDYAYSIAEVLETLFDIKFSEADHFNICSECFKLASTAYKFHLLTKRSNEILNFYTDAILCNIDSMELLQDQISTNSLCMSLPFIVPETDNFDYSMSGIGLVDDKSNIKETLLEARAPKESVKEIIEPKKEILEPKKEILEPKKEILDDDFVIVIDDKGKRKFYNMLQDGSLVEAYENKDVVVPKEKVQKVPKMRRKRVPMLYRECSRCSMKYRFMSRLKEHMKTHNVELHVCKVCKFITEDELEYHNHLAGHTNIHQCAECGIVFKKRISIIKHLKSHQKITSHICDICGACAASEAELDQHREAKHCKRFTCFYCGRMYKGEASFEKHIRKHEARQTNGNTKQPKVDLKKYNKKECTICGKFFVDDRALMWHQRLHNDDKPFSCEICGRRFVSRNRRSQHALCAHSAPSLRCPLCPALFHLRSMINTHIKKVHLAAHKRRCRTKSNGNWLTPAVPVQELSVDIQDDILALQAAAPKQAGLENYGWQHQRNLE